MKIKGGKYYYTGNLSVLVQLKLLYTFHCVYSTLFFPDSVFVLDCSITELEMKQPWNDFHEWPLSFYSFAISDTHTEPQDLVPTPCRGQGHQPPD